MRAGLRFWVRLALVALLALVAALPLVTQAAAADAPKRRALVIGIDGYTDPDLSIPGNRTGEDAIEVANVLQTVAQYDTVVTVPRNANKRAFAKALAEFSTSIHDGDLVVIFYSGHGVEFGGDNYFLLADAEVPLPASEIETKSDLQTTAVSQRGLLEDLRRQHPGNIVLIINACRDSVGPAATLGVGDGAIDIPAPSNRVEADPGTMVIYATSSGKPARVCLDRDCSTDTSPMTVFTRRLVETLATPNLAAKDLVNVVGREVETDVDQSIGETQRVSFDDQISFRLKDTLFLGPVQVASLDPAQVDPTKGEEPKTGPAKGDEAKGDLGVDVTPKPQAGASFAAQLGLALAPDPDGLAVQTITDSSRAADKGFITADHILAVNNQQVASLADFEAAIGNVLDAGRSTALIKATRKGILRYIGLPVDGLTKPAADASINATCPDDPLPDSPLEQFFEGAGTCPDSPPDTPGYLGIGIQNVTADIASALGLESTTGALLTKPVTGAPGDLAGLKSGDVIQSVDGVEVPDAAGFQAMIGARSAGAVVELRIFRDGTEQTISATLGARPKQASQVVPPPAPLPGVTLVPDSNGVRVASVEPGAAGGDLAVDDVVTRVGNLSVSTVEDFGKAMRSVETSGHAAALLGVIRGFDTIHLGLPVAKAPEPAVAPQGKDALAIAGRARLTETAGDGSIRDIEGAFSWFMDKDDAGEPVLLGFVRIPEAGLAVDLTISKRVDAKLGAAQAIDARFNVAKSFAGYSVVGLTSLAVEDSVGGTTSTIAGKSTRAGAAFQFTLRSAPADAVGNGAMLRAKVMSLSLAYASGTHATLTLEKYADIQSIFDQAYAQWTDGFVGFGTEKTEADARAAVAALQQKLVGQVDVAQLQVRFTNLGAKGIVYRVGLPVLDVAEATSICKQVHKSGLAACTAESK